MSSLCRFCLSTSEWTSALAFNSEAMNQIASWFMYSCVSFFSPHQAN